MGAPPPPPPPQYAYAPGPPPSQHATYIPPVPLPTVGMSMGSILDSAQEFKIVQTRKGCLQECCGCDANSEFRFVVHGKHEAMLYEQSTCCVRLCCGTNRWWDTTMSLGTHVGADINTIRSFPVLYHFHRTYACPTGCAKCCCYQQVDVQDGNGTPLGMVKESCWYCLPTYHTVTPQHQLEYEIHMPSCCGGCCVNCCSQGCCNCRIPFLIYRPQGGEDSVLKASQSSPVPTAPQSVPDAQITKVWAGLATEFLTDASTFELKVPDGADSTAKARLIAATLLINQNHFESGNDGG